MEELKSKISFIKGLATGLDIDEKSKEGQLFSKIIEALDAIVDSIEDLRSDYDELFDYTEAIDEDLTELESDFYEMSEIEEEEKGEEEEEDNLTIECPDCGEMVVIDDDILEDDEGGEVLCPSCERVVFVNEDEWEEIEGEDKKDNPETNG